MNTSGSEADSGRLVGIMAIVCTDRGQHKRARIADVRWYADGHWRMTAPLSKRPSFYPPLNTDGEDSCYIFDCPRCARTPYLSRQKWIGAVEGRLHPRHWGDGVLHSELDVSNLPF